MTQLEILLKLCTPSPTKARSSHCPRGSNETIANLSPPRIFSRRKIVVATLPAGNRVEVYRSEEGCPLEKLRHSYTWYVKDDPTGAIGLTRGGYEVDGGNRALTSTYNNKTSNDFKNINS
jgi:hypothetical protein